MKIAALHHAVPSAAITNDALIARLRESNRARFSEGQLDKLEKRLRRGFATAGTEVRYILAEGERAIDFVKQAVRDALAECDMRPEELGFVIYAGVGRGLIEPSMAHVIQREIGAVNATCFDIIDACASWLRALEVAHGLFLGGAYGRGLVVNCECGFEDYATMELESLDDLDTCFAGFTVGEAVTATVLTAEEAERDYYISFKTYAEHVDLCLIPLDNADKFIPQYNGHAYVPGKFYSNSAKLISLATRRIIECFQKDTRLRSGTHDICFSHSASEAASRIIGDKVLSPETLYYPINRRYGNTVSASVPLAMSLAYQEGRLKRGDRVLVVIGSAGLTVAFAAFQF